MAYPIVRPAVLLLTQDPRISHGQQDYGKKTMDILQLEHFLAVADEGTFTRAAEKVFRTQPALSQSIRKLEEQVGSPLFARDLHDVSLTEAGKMLAEYARRMIDLRDEALRRVAQLRNLETGTLTIAAHEAAAVYLLRNPLRRFLQLFPNIKVGVERSRLTDIPRKIMDREAQIGFVKEVPAFRELVAANVHSDELVLITSPRNPYASRTQLEIEELDQVPIMVHHLCRADEEVLHRTFRQHGLNCRVIAELWNFESIKSFVQDDVGLAIVPRITVLRELAAGSLVAIPTVQLKIPCHTYMIVRQDYISEPAQEFIKIMRSIRATDFMPLNFSHSEELCPALKVALSGQPPAQKLA
jgi:DNA-binding transcriptional LysR family regulator